MGTIVVVKKNTSVVIASDCCNVRDAAMRTNLNISHGCILKFGQSYIGLNASLGFQQAFEELLQNWSADSLPALASRAEIRHFFSKIHDVLKQYHNLYVNYNQSQEFEWTPMTALVANNSGIYKVDSIRAVYQFTKFWAIGTGEPYALGAMAAVYDLADTSEDIARLGLEAVKELEVDFDRRPEIFQITLKNAVIAVPINSKPAKKNIKGKQPKDLKQVRKPRNKSS